MLAVCEFSSDRFCNTSDSWILAVTTHRTLGLRRGAAAEAFLSPDTTYGLTRGQPRHRTRPDAGASVVDETAPEPAVEHIQPAVESDLVIEGIETAAPVSQEPPASEHPGYWEWEDGELIPDHGPYVSREGYRWMHGVPAFLVEDRPVSNIR